MATLKPPARPPRVGTTGGGPPAPLHALTLARGSSVIRVKAVSHSGERYILYVHVPLEFIGTHNGEAITDATVSMGPPLLMSTSLRSTIVKEAGEKHDPQISLAGYAIQYPNDSAFDDLRSQTATELFASSQEDGPHLDLSEKICRVVRYLYHIVPQTQIHLAALNWLKGYIFTMENANADFCSSALTSSRCMRVQLSTAAEVLPAFPDLLSTSCARLARRLSRCLYDTEHALSDTHISVMQLCMMGVLVPGSTEKGLGMAGFALTHESVDVHVSLDDLVYLKQCLNLGGSAVGENKRIMTIRATPETTTASTPAVQQMVTSGLLATGVGPRTSILVSKFNVTS